jgi:hypothetical protein
MDRNTRSWLVAYGVIAAITFLFQIWIRLSQCEGAASCSLSLAKGVIWSGIWPAYWIVYLAGFVPSGAN